MLCCCCTSLVEAGKGGTEDWSILEIEDGAEEAARSELEALRDALDGNPTCDSRGPDTARIADDSCPPEHLVPMNALVSCRAEGGNWQRQILDRVGYARTSTDEASWSVVSAERPDRTMSETRRIASAESAEGEILNHKLTCSDFAVVPRKYCARRQKKDKPSARWYWEADCEVHVEIECLRCPDFGTSKVLGSGLTFVPLAWH